MAHYPRFIHSVDLAPTPKHSGFTIAYARADDHVFFSVSLVSNADEYNKHIGRALTTQNLLQNIDSILDGYSHYCLETRLGVLTIEDIRAMTELSYMLADSAEITMMDLKHAFISNVLRNFVYFYYNTGN